MQRAKQRGQAEEVPAQTSARGRSLRRARGGATSGSRSCWRDSGREEEGSAHIVGRFSESSTEAWFSDLTKPSIHRDLGIVPHMDHARISSEWNLEAPSGSCPQSQHFHSGHRDVPRWNPRRAGAPAARLPCPSDPALRPLLRPGHPGQLSRQGRTQPSPAELLDRLTSISSDTTKSAKMLK